jgi:colanic acid/amylovoran biosynthesis glycosyltransferase
MLELGGFGGPVLARRFRSSPPIAIHAHFGVIAATQTSLARSLDAPLLASFYGYDAAMSRIVDSSMWQRRYRRLFGEVGAVLVEGPAMGARVAKLGCPEDRLRVVRLPADEAGLEGILRTSPETFVVAAAGRFVPKKGFDTAIHAFARALRGRDATLMLIGGGDLAAAHRQLVHDTGIEDQVKWFDALPFRDFMSLLASASVAVFPSRTAPDGDSEGGAPVTLIETQWLGVPTLVSDHDDLPFAAAPGGSVVLPPTDVDAWAGALRAAYDDPGALAEMGRKGAAFSKENNSPQANSAMRESIYAELAGYESTDVRRPSHA